MEAVKANSGLSLQTFSLYYDSGRDGAMADALRALCSSVEEAVSESCDIVVLSDRLPDGQQPQLERPPIPTLLAVGAVHHHLIRHAPADAACCIHSGVAAPHVHR